MNWMIPSLILGAVLTCWAIKFAVYSKLGFWIEVWRQPYLAFVLFARDPAWKVCQEEPTTLPSRDGWVGPVLLRVGNLRIGAYVDRDRVIESMARIKAALVHERKSNRNCAGNV